MSIVNKTKNTILADTVEVADTMVSRAVGLLGRSSLPAQQALIITHCSSIHMFFMRFAIDAIFIDKNGQVVGCVENIRPFQLSRCFWRAHSVIELPVGSIAQSKTAVGDLLRTPLQD